MQTRMRVQDGGSSGSYTAFELEESKHNQQKTQQHETKWEGEEENGVSKERRKTPEGQEVRQRAEEAMMRGGGFRKWIRLRSLKGERT